MMKTATSAPNRRTLQGAELLLLAVLIAAAAYLWSGPWRAERALRNASFDALLAASKRDPNNPRVFYYLGLRLRDLGHLGPARAAFARAGTLDPDDEETCLAWGNTAAAFGQDQEAFSVLSQCAQKHPKSARAHLDLALFCETHYALQKAYDEATAAARDDPQNAAAWRLAGVTAIQLQYLPEAEKDLRQAASLAPKDWHNQLALGQVLTTLHRPDEALRCYQQASSLAPNQGGVTFALGQAQLDHAATPADLETARQTLQRAVDQTPNSPAALTALGQAEVRLQRWPDAKQTLLQAEQLAPNNADVHFDLARVLRQLGDPSAAAKETLLHDRIKSYEEEKLSLGAQARAGNNNEARLKLARLCRDHGDYQEAIMEYRNVLRHTPDLQAARAELAALERAHPEPAAVSAPAAEPAPALSPGPAIPIPQLVRDADSMLSHERYPEAEQAYRNIIARDANNALAYQGLGKTLLGLGKNIDAFYALNTALHLDPKLPEAQFDVAHLYYNQGFVDEAARRMEVLIKQVPNNPDYLHALGTCYLGDPPKYLTTEQLFKQAVTLAPNNPVFLRDLAKAEVNINNFTGAEQDYRHALTVAPNDEETMVQFGIFLLDHNPDPARRQEAEQLLRKAAAINGKDAEALTGLGRIELQRHNIKQAISDLKQAISGDPNEESAWLNLGRAFDLDGQPQMARDCRKSFHDISTYRMELSNTEEQAQMNTKDPALRLKLARLYATGGQNARAINQYRVYLSMNPHDPAVQKELDGFIARLQASGQMPSMDALNAMLLASSKSH